MYRPLVIYKTLLNRSLLIVLFFSPHLSAIEFKHELQEEFDTVYTEEVFRDDNEAPTIFFGKKDPKCRKNCSNALSFDGKRKLTFPKKSYLLTTTRYTGESFAIIRQPIKDSSYSHFYFISSSSLNKSFSYKLIFMPCSSSSTIITRDGALVCLSEKTIEIYKTIWYNMNLFNLSWKNIKIKEDKPLPQFNRFSFYDPFGNRIELLEKI